MDDVGSFGLVLEPELFIPPPAKVAEKAAYLQENVLIENYAIPDKVTTYTNVCLDLGNLTPGHIVEMGHVVDETGKPFLHHMLATFHKEADCGGTGVMLWGYNITPPYAHFALTTHTVHKPHTSLPLATRHTVQVLILCTHQVGTRGRQRRDAGGSRHPCGTSGLSQPDVTAAL
jgi:hypothetical protein